MLRQQPRLTGMPPSRGNKGNVCLSPQLHVCSLAYPLIPFLLNLYPPPILRLQG